MLSMLSMVCTACSPLNLIQLLQVDGHFGVDCTLYSRCNIGFKRKLDGKVCTSPPQKRSFGSMQTLWQGSPWIPWRGSEHMRDQ